MEEWKIGEIRQVNGEWYQCILAIGGCRECSFRTQNCCTRLPECMSTERSDGNSVIFKKLEKVGLPSYNSDNKLCQEYRCYIAPLITDDIVYVLADNRVVIEVKQNKKEDMEEERDYSEEEFKTNPRFQYHKPIEQVINMKKVKPFDLEAAKAGKPVYTRDGRKARIICFDVNNDKPIVAVICCKDGKETYPYTFYPNGLNMDNNVLSNTDLMMLPEKKEGWVNIDKGGSGKIAVSSPYSTKEEAIHNDNETTIDTIKISWEE